MWRVCKQAGRPWPVLSDDPVIDYMVMEAVAIKVGKQDEKARKDAERTAKRKQQFDESRIDRNEGELAELEFESLEDVEE